MWSKYAITVIGLWCSIVLFGCTYMRERAFDVITQDDNFIEEKIEDVIEDYTGLDIDLTSEDSK